MAKKSRADKATSSRAKILDAAFALFVEQGYHGASLQSIAKKAGVNKALLFYYFDNKENLFHQSFHSLLKSFLEETAKKSSLIASPKKRLEYLIDAYLERFKKGQELLHITYSEAASTSRFSRECMKKFIIRGLQPIEETISYGIEKGTFNNVNPRMAAISLIGMLRIFGIQERITGKHFKAKEIGKNAKEIFIRGLLKSEK